MRYADRTFCYLSFSLNGANNEFRIFEKSVNCIETLNGAAADVDAARFQWHIGKPSNSTPKPPLTSSGGIASFQAIMHVLSELRNPLFDAPDRQRALRALQMSRILRENNGAKAWQAVKNMIDKAVAEHNASPRAQSQSSSSFSSPHAPIPAPMPLDNPSNSNVSVYPMMGTIPSYAMPNPVSGQFPQKSIPPQTQSIPQHSNLMQSIPPVQDQTEPCWDDINLSNINNIIDVQPTPGIVPDFDFVSSIIGARNE